MRQAQLSSHARVRVLKYQGNLKATFTPFMHSIDDVHFQCTRTPDDSSQDAQLLRQLDYEINRVRENLLLGRTHPGVRPE